MLKNKFEQFCGVRPLITALAALFVFVSGAAAQISAGGTPQSKLSALKSATPTETMATVNAADYLAEDALESKDVPRRFGAPFDVALNLKNAGVWETLANGDRVWRLRIASPEAYSINLVYDSFFMPEGAEFFVYNDNYEYVIGAFTSFNNKAHGMFSTQPVPGDAITLEYFEPAAVTDQGRLSIMRVVHAYRNMFGRAGSLDDFGTSGSCNNNVACDNDWNDQERGVVMLLTSGGFRFCSGSLINTVGDLGTPYILTANHCDPGATDVAMFNYQSATCSPNQNGPTNQTISGGIERFNSSSNNSSDCSLWQLSATPPAGYNVYYNGWNANNVAATASVCIHHPDGDVKKISWENNAVTSSSYGSTANTHWRVADWDDGTTEPGSSGSPLFDQNHRITGQLHGGTAACGNNLPDYFGKFSYSMTAGLRSWLDPATTGAMTLDGYDPNAVVQSITVTNPNTAVTWYTGENYSITWNSTGLSENVQIQINRSYPGGAWEVIAASTADDGSHAWNVIGPLTSSARIRVRGAVTTTVFDDSNVNFTIGERTITVTNPNTALTWVEGGNVSITWTSSNVSGNVNLHLNRDYPVGGWETIQLNTTNDGTHPWNVTLPATTTARVRVTSVSYPAISDESDVNFTIQPLNTPPVIAHDRLHDQATDAFPVTAEAADLESSVTVVFYYRLIGAGSYSSLAMSATGNGDEFSATPNLAAGDYEYYIEATDLGALAAQTDVLNFTVGDFCGQTQVFDDGTAEASHWSQASGYQWGVRFDAGASDYVLCSAQIGISADKPTAEYSALNVFVYLADGVGGLPGTLVTQKSIGSLGNVVGGVPVGVDNFVDVVFHDPLGDPLVLTGDFYVAVGNISAGEDALLHDEDGSAANRSVVYDPCDELWLDENDAHDSARPGNRMIRASGYPLEPLTVVVYPAGADLALNWNNTGAPYYHVYSATVTDGPFATLEGTVATNSFVDTAPPEEIKFYIVISSATP